MPAHTNRSRNLRSGELETRDAAIRRGKLLENFTVAWNLLEGLVAVGAGLLAGSIALVGFGIDLHDLGQFCSGLNVETAPRDRRQGRSSGASTLTFSPVLGELGMSAVRQSVDQIVEIQASKHRTYLVGAD